METEFIIEKRSNKLLVTSLPFLNQWKMLGEGDYVVGLEPCNVKCANRSILRQEHILPYLKPGETSEMQVDIGILEGDKEIKELKDKIKAIIQ